MVERCLCIANNHTATQHTPTPCAFHTACLEQDKEHLVSDFERLLAPSAFQVGLSLSFHVELAFLHLHYPHQPSRCLPHICSSIPFPCFSPCPFLLLHLSSAPSTRQIKKNTLRTNAPQNLLPSDHDSQILLTLCLVRGHHWE